MMRLALTQTFQVGGLGEWDQVDRAESDLAYSDEENGGIGRILNSGLILRHC